MKRDQKPYIIFFGFSALLAIYFLFSDPSAQSSKNSEQNTADASVSESSQGMDNNRSRGGASSGNGAHSLFESDFFQAGAPEKPIRDSLLEGDSGADGEPDILDPSDKDNPINPQTGKPYPNSIMNQFQELAEKFPENSIIPRKKTPEAIEQEKELRTSMYAIQSAVAQGNASQEDINRYYDYKIKPVKDRLELLDYVLEKSVDSMSPDIKQQYEKIQTTNRSTLENYEKERQKALSKSSQ